MNPLPKALHDCCDLRECSTSSGAEVVRRRRCVRNGEALEASGVKSQPNSANGEDETRDVHLMSDVAGGGERRAQVGIRVGRVPGENVASVGVQDDPRESASTRESWSKRGQAARAQATAH
jgi:hypothetical protein